MPCLRVTCATVTPASPSFRIATICDSVNRDFFIRTSGEISCQKNPVIAVYREGELTNPYEASIVCGCPACQRRAHGGGGQSVIELPLRASLLYSRSWPNRDRCDPD